MKLNGVLSKSDRAIEAEENNRFPMTTARKKLRERLQGIGVKATLYGCERLLELHGFTGEWHHISKFAREVEYYDVDSVAELFSDAPSKELFLVAKSSKPKQQKCEAINVTVKLKYRDYISKSRYRMSHYQGTATVAGEWIEFGGKRKRLSGKFLEVCYFTDESHLTTDIHEEDRPPR